MAHESSQSRGKGSRRWPGRAGGAHKRKKQEWEHQAVHMVASRDDLPTPVVSLMYSKPWRKDAAESIYLFDQEAAKAGIVYHAEYTPRTSRWHVFSISVREKDSDAVQKIIDRL